VADRALRALADAEPAVFWLDDPAAPDPAPPPVVDVDCDLAVLTIGTLSRGGSALQGVVSGDMSW
jgi:hypothetical protein